MAKSDKSQSTPLYLQIILVLIALGLVYLVLQKFVFSSLDKKIDDLRPKEQKLLEQVQMVMAYEQKKAEYEQIYQSRLAELEREKRILPKEKETNEVVRRFERLATESRDIRITEFFPSPRPIDHGFYAEWPISVKCESSFHSLGTFFESIANFDRIFNVMDLTLESQNLGSDNKPTLRATFKASTFVYTDDQSEKMK